MMKLLLSKIIIIYEVHFDDFYRMRRLWIKFCLFANIENYGNVCVNQQSTITTNEKQQKKNGGIRLLKIKTVECRSCNVSQISEEMSILQK